MLHGNKAVVAVAFAAGVGVAGTAFYSNTVVVGSPAMASMMSTGAGYYGCSSNYGSDTICCGQPDDRSDYKGATHQCTREFPYCTSYKANEYYGHCVAVVTNIGGGGYITPNKQSDVIVLSQQ